MYSILAEDKSDVACLEVLIKRLKNNDSEKIKGKGFKSCGNMLNQGKRALKAHEQLGYNKFIICYDRDKDTVQQRYQEVISKIIKPSGIKIKKDNICILIPVEEIEAWILADIQAVSKVFPSWKPIQNFPTPESVINPKEKLKQLSQIKKSKPLYIHDRHNQDILKHVDLKTVKDKCPSFKKLANFIEENRSNYPQNYEI